MSEEPTVESDRILTLSDLIRTFAECQRRIQTRLRETGYIDAGKNNQEVQK